MIIVEDDLLFSPDFYEYFHAVGPIVVSGGGGWGQAGVHQRSLLTG